MMSRLFKALVCTCVIGAIAWQGRGVGDEQEASKWREMQMGVWQSAGLPCSYALIEQEAALVIDAAEGADLEALKKRAAKIELVLLTHHHRDTCARAEEWFKSGIYVQAPKASAEWLTPTNVEKYWKESLPLRNSRTAYLVVPAGLQGIDCTLDDGQVINWRGWTIQPVATPGHSRDHMAFAARKGNGPIILFCGDALAGPGKIWSPYTTDWDHWTDAGLKPAAESLRKLARLRPAVLCPAHGAPIASDAVAALEKTAQAVETNAFLKSYERFSKDRLGNQPSYAFLAKDQAGSAGEKPWSQLSEHLFYTGNTYVLASKDNVTMVVDPWGKRSADQIAKLRSERHLGPIELVMFSHAHYDHYDGVYELPDRDKFQVWSLDTVARPIGDPFFYRAPFLDARPVRFERRLKDGASATWHEYSLRFRHFPGQSYFTMAVETEIDGKKCVFTGDNFFHVDLYSGTGGWMGLNRSWPDYYAASARLLLDLHPEWVLAEHGGAFEFNAEDIRRRVRWAEEAARAADGLSPSGNHRLDWDPHRIHVEPLLMTARPDDTLQLELVVSNPLNRPREMAIQLAGRGIVADWTRSLTVAAGATSRQAIVIRINAKAKGGRYVLPIRVREGDCDDPVDAFVVVDVKS